MRLRSIKVSDLFYTYYGPQILSRNLKLNTQLACSSILSNGQNQEFQIGSMFLMTKPSPKRIFVAFILGIGLCCLLDAAEKGPINTDKNGSAVKGYDTVAYFTEGQPVKGRKEHSAEWMGATWYFSRESHKDMFLREPEKYAPQYGGYCAYAMASGDLVDITPKAWKIVNDRLYLNYSRSVHRKWEKDIPGYIEKADKNWPVILKTLIKDE